MANAAAEAVLAAGLDVGVELDRERRAPGAPELVGTRRWRRRHARSRRRDLTEQELAERLARARFPGCSAARRSGRLVRAGAVDDERFAGARARARLPLGAPGDALIRHDLTGAGSPRRSSRPQSKHSSRSVLGQSASSSDAGRSLETARHLARKGFSRGLDRRHAAEWPLRKVPLRASTMSGAVTDILPAQAQFPNRSHQPKRRDKGRVDDHARRTLRGTRIDRPGLAAGRGGDASVGPRSIRNLSRAGTDPRSAMLVIAAVLISAPGHRRGGTPRACASSEDQRGRGARGGGDDPPRGARSRRARRPCSLRAEVEREIGRAARANVEDRGACPDPRGRGRAQAEGARAPRAGRRRPRGRTSRSSRRS